MFAHWREQLPVRIGGTIIGLGFLGFGLFAWVGPGVPVAAEAAEKARWFGGHLIFAGVTAVGVSWWAKDLSGIWCRRDRPLRLPWRRAR